LTLGDGWKTAISEYYANTGCWPTISNLAGMCNSQGKYESSITVANGGVIAITYGNQANTKINGNTLSLVPYTNANNDVLWVCGTSTAPATSVATIASGATVASTVPSQYLPTSCHS
jgi:type IV pilus assembly protein PilA